MKMVFVGKVEARWFAVEDIGPRHKEGGARKVFGNGVELGQCEQFSKSLLCGWDRLARLTLGDDTETVTRWRNRHKINTRGIIINNFIFNNIPLGNNTPQRLRDA